MKKASPLPLHGDGLTVLEAGLELEGVFWFHTYAQPRDKYTHVAAPLIHNYPLTLAFLGKPAEAYAAVSGRITFAYRPEEVWREEGFYVYPAVSEKIVSRIQLFSMGGTGYVQFKPRTRASVPDYAANQVFLPGTRFKTYIIARRGYRPPRIVRLGAKRYGVFSVHTRRMRGVVKGGGGEVTHPFNARDVGAAAYHGVLRHYAGPIAISGVVERVVRAGSAVLALPRFIDV